MPSHNKRASIPQRPKPSPVNDDLLIQEEETLIDNTARLGKKRSKYATAGQAARSPSEEENTEDTDPQLDEDHFPPLSQPQHQIPRAFPLPPHESAGDTVTELGISEKVSDDHTPPQEPSLPPGNYGRSSPTGLLPGLTHIGTPPTHPGYLERGGFSTRSPPVSPPQVKARPVSFGGRLPSYHASSRASPAPYAYPPSAYGSPPNLPPHLPQQHFYNAQDVSLGFGSNPAAKKLSPTLIKGSRLSIPGQKEENAILLGYHGQLDVLTQHEQGLDRVGSLRNLPGTVLDAVVLSWATGVDPYQEQRPLIALTLCLADVYNEGPTGYLGSATSRTLKQRYTLAVVAYSLKHLAPVAELLVLPNQIARDAASQMPATFAAFPTLQAHGNFVVASFSVNGETFVFSPNLNKEGPAFECLTKVWTTPQPRHQRRDSSHARPSDSDAFPADPARAQGLLDQPIFSLNGRWLAYCPTSSDVRSFGAALGEKVVTLGNPTISSRSPTGRPTVTCAIESPDAPTLLGRMAKGAAQGILLGAGMARERGMQLWRNYWNPDAESSSSATAQIHGTPSEGSTDIFPPTHANSDVVGTVEPEVIAIIDLKALQDRADSTTPTAVFQPTGGCSYLSFTPNGLGLFTASRRGDMQYVWDLFQMRHSRAMMLPQDHEVGQLPARVRQIAKYERMSPSVIVDIEWETPLGSRFSVLTQNRTIHMFDLPTAALRWPPPRGIKKQEQRPPSASTEKSSEPASATSVAAGFMASARAFAGSSQPMLANLRGRAPSASSGVSGAGSSGLELASATGLRSGKVVAAGFSKSLGAATDTVAQLRHAGQSRLHLTMHALPGRMVWRHKEEKSVLTILDSNGARNYFVRKTTPRERRVETVSVFDARKPVGNRFPTDIAPLDPPAPSAFGDGAAQGPGFWKLESDTQGASSGLTAPLGQAEIETNAPYQPFHSDQRVSMSVYSEGQAMAESHYPTASIIFQHQPKTQASSATDKWVFGGDIPTVRLDLGHRRKEAQDPQRSVMYRETTSNISQGADMEQIVSTTTRRRPKPLGQEPHLDSSATVGDEEDFFEDDMDVLEFATDRV